MSSAGALSWHAARNGWQKLSFSNRLLLILGGAAVLLSIWVTLALSTRTEPYQPLFSNLLATDAAEIVARLEEQGVAHKLVDHPGGMTISVPADQVYRLRLDMASQGLPKGGVVGFEALGDIPMGATDFDRRMQYLRALQGELTRTIQQIEGVSHARVHVSLPEQSIFTQNRVPPTAAVLLEIAPGMTPSASQVRGIIHLVSSSVEGLRAENITVIDQTGIILSNMEEESSLAGGLTTGGNLSLQEKFQQELQTNLQSLLDQVFGPGNSVARVTAELNFNSEEIEENTLLPVDEVQGTGFVTRIQELQEEFEGTGSPPTDPTSGNLSLGNVNAAAGESNYTRSDSSREYDYNRVIRRTSIPPGTVQRLSVAVVVNRQLTPVQQGEISNLVASAIGFDAARQDQISVTGMAFDRSLIDALGDSADPAQEETENQTSDQYPRVYLAGAAAGILLLAMLLFSVLRNRRLRARRESEQEQLGAIIDWQSKEMQFPTSLTDDEPQKEEPPVEQEWLQSAKRNPEQVARIIRAWMNEN